MSRSRLWLILLASILYSGIVGCSARMAKSASPLTPDSYSLYSSIYHYQIRSGELLGIATVPLSFPTNQTCLKPSTVEEREMVSAAQNQNSGPPEWKPQFDFSHRYLLIPPTDVNKAIDCIQFSRTSHLASCEKYANLQYVRSLSIPIFNKDHTRALVFMTRSCGGLCGNGGSYVFRKTIDGWNLERNSFAACRWVS